MTRSSSGTRSRALSRRALPSPLVPPPAPHASTLKTVAPLHRRIARALRTTPALVACLVVSGVAMATYLLIQDGALTAGAMAPQRQVAAKAGSGHLPRLAALLRARAG